MLEPRRPGDRPRPREPLVARVGLEIATLAGPAVANAGSIAGRSATSGIRHGSEDEARNVSERRITGVR